ncbi:MAG: Sec-independent protein translocase subunit TatB [Propionibacteriaceae bacterium]|jgi:sec-independent protein translocase protein TatB|nr:Sec-independent protein translocase subunit TatB [Propionibacteriaceae bacterium]
MIDINGPEILVLLVLAVIIFGPEKLPDLARKAARVLNYLRGIANDAQGRLREELGPEFADLNLANLNPKALAASVLDPVKTEVDGIAGSVTEVRDSLTQTAAELSASPSSEADPEPVGAAMAQRPSVPFDIEAT